MKTLKLETSQINSRAIAAKILTAVLHDKKSLRDVTLLEKPDAFAQVLCYGVLRSYFQLDFFLSKLVQRPVKESEIKALLLIGLYQIFFLDTPDYAAVAETVNAVKQLKKTWATKLVNGVLRNALRSKKDLQQKTQDDATVFYNHPLWLIEKIQLAYPEDWKTILDNNHQPPPMTLRLNSANVSREFYLNKLKDENIEALATANSPFGITLKKPLPVTEIDGFNEGLVSVQDEAAQLAASLLDLSSGQKVLDACAAPGGKTTHILELAPNLGELVAVDQDAARLKLIQSNLDRQKLFAKLVDADIKIFAAHWQPAYFDRILLDAPCSATGVIRRHPDIKLLRKSSDIARLAKEQYEILTAVWPLLKPDGILVYATCSILPEENFLILEAFLKNTSDAKEEPIIADWGKAMSMGRQILPGESNMDGFYYARLRKES